MDIIQLNHQDPDINTDQSLNIERQEGRRRDYLYQTFSDKQFNYGLVNYK